ncbi:MAG: undecaprenyldiphospho-muramoylpentapeptide beta-N-acetylglucosaminyltransferase [Deltaproteobacteria bacterium RIFCSPLOWO2_02_FULL_44_10]|nr:MAG: undecaprenyldiphospho-muramoylpentapeptide beta-N-acetylglucosaminyltransferase [Deltaproteobacteria bacterium RIFCSPHIGHO2_02_FULL_44_16]OGQ46160.1 MAG: undecaprenyldiphospho-muramoylpentapeptide beta-N-acetylglucosaminyltransferase [Deltaproteobacteria bacterium RIFCSPLOWO2_02_FULL_44_10]
MKILIAAGGTGGHLFPGVALAESFVKRDGISVLFVGTMRGLETKLLPPLGWKLLLLPAVSLKDRHGIKKITSYARLPLLLFRAFCLVMFEKPSRVVSIGGYAAGPVTLVASLLRIPTVLLEPNAIPGLTTRLLARWVSLICLGLPEAARALPQKKVMLTGTPVRKSILGVRSKSSKEKVKPFTVLCFGGSQGAQKINRAVLEALPHLQELTSSLRFIHQIGTQEKRERVKQVYTERGFEASVFEFIGAMEKVYEEADLVIARAGAMTIAELTIATLPSILIPYPYSADDHQRANAESLVRIGGATMILEAELTGERLANEIKKLTEDSRHLLSMSQALLKRRQPDAAERIVNECLNVK